MERAPEQQLARSVMLRVPSSPPASRIQPSPDPTGLLPARPGAAVGTAPDPLRKRREPVPRHRVVSPRFHPPRPRDRTRLRRRATAAARPASTCEPPPAEPSKRPEMASTTCPATVRPNRASHACGTGSVFSIDPRRQPVCVSCAPKGEDSVSVSVSPLSSCASSSTSTLTVFDVCPWRKPHRTPAPPRSPNPLQPSRPTSRSAPRPFQSFAPHPASPRTTSSAPAASLHPRVRHRQAREPHSCPPATGFVRRTAMVSPSVQSMSMPSQAVPGFPALPSGSASARLPI